MKEMTISLNQLYPVPGSITGNKSRILAAIASAGAEGAELVCFPECSLTGYTVEEAAKAAVSADDGAVRGICEAAEKNRVTVSFGFIEKCAGKLFITQMITGPERTVCYRKTHLGSKEKTLFEPGDRLTVYRAGELCIGVCLCWESHIPDIATFCRGQGIQLLLVPYASGMTGLRCRELWDRHLPARASDNGIFVAACNGLCTADGKRSGGLAVYDPKGVRIAESFGEDETALVCRIGGILPREREENMHHISYFDHRRPELYTFLPAEEML